jgi:glycosyltransferase involved in cell wall biosynthesis
VESSTATQGIRLDIELPHTLAVGRGTCLPVSGSLDADRGALAPALALDGEAHPSVSTGIERDDAGERRAGFAALVPVSPVDEPRTATLRLELGDARGGRSNHTLAEIGLTPDVRRPDAPRPRTAGGSPVVAICMATFEPEPKLLERQISSLRDQTHDAWVCVISDGGSSPARSDELRSLVADDPRFAVSRSEHRLGFYRNFERALAMAPDDVGFVALADQDDRWHPDKLATLLAGLGDARLGYSDTRVVDDAGRTMSDSFWRGRRNNYTNLASLLLSNTVAGAASVFRREVLALALPFPPPVGRAFHDQWIASVALATGSIAYVDRPLYDYVQHGEASLGHAAALREYDPRRVIRWRDPRGTTREIAAHGRRSYLENALRIAVAARTLEMRTAGTLAPSKARAVRRAARLATGPEPFAWLAARSLRRLGGRNETMGIELSLIAALAWRRLAAAEARRRVR